jgi:hypothetical protein
VSRSEKAYAAFGNFVDESQTTSDKDAIETIMEEAIWN